MLFASSMAVCRAGAAAQNIPLYEYISQLFGPENFKDKFPVPSFNIIMEGSCRELT